MNDNVLKKEFSKKDVQRARNLVTGDTSARITEGVGYTKQYEYHQEGDIWEENGKKWTIKNGLKQNITKLDKFKKMGTLPLFCPECNNLMKKELDKKVYPAYQKCFDCIIDYEAELQKQGKLEEHFDNLRNNHIDSAIAGYKSFMVDQLASSNSNDHFVTEAGDVENWKGGISKEELEQQLQEGLEFLENMKIK
jgi:DNA-directed RNA polymerase subunit M/transcription elongation factor TFIIS